MEWNNGKKRLAFEKVQAKKRKEYLNAGMTEEQIQKVYEFDKQWYNSCRREAEHTQKFDNATFNDEEENASNNPLYKKFLHNFATTDKYWSEERFDWIEQIENKELYKVLSNMSEEDKEILTEVLFDGFNQTEIAAHLKISHQAISKKFKKFKIIFEKWLQK